VRAALSQQSSHGSHWKVTPISIEPPAYADREHGRMRCSGNRRAGLVGQVGVSTACAIYAVRPDVCRACLPGDDSCKMHAGASIFRGLAVWWANQATFNSLRQLTPLTRAVQMRRLHGVSVNHSGFDGDGQRRRNWRRCGGPLSDPARSSLWRKINRPFSRS
jgi:hypothetical protein